MFIFDKKTISMCVLICSLSYQEQSLAGRESEKKSPLRSQENESERRSAKKNFFQKGKGNFWSFSTLDKSGKKLKANFIKMARWVQKIDSQSGNQFGFISKNGGKSIRFRSPFNLEMMKETLDYLPYEGGDSEEGSPYTLRANFERSLESFYNNSLDFFRNLGVRYTPSIRDSALPRDAVFKGTKDAEDFLSQFNIVRSQDWIDHMSVELRLIEGEARALAPHIDGNVYFVLSIDAQGVYEQKPGQALLLPDGNSYLWFGGVANELPRCVKECLETCGVQKDRVLPLPHGVAATTSGNFSSLLLIFSKVDACSYRLFPKSEENFQNFIPNPILTNSKKKKLIKS